MSEKEKDAPQGAIEEPREPVVADYTDSQDREEEHEQQREKGAVQPEPKPKKKGNGKDEDDARFRGILNETLSEREKRQAAERERDQYKRAWEDHQKKLQTEPNDPAPDMFKDPKGFVAWTERQADRRAKAMAQQHITPLTERLSDYALKVSEMQAEKALGQERWNKLNDWIAKQDPQFKAWAMQQSDPYAAAYQHYRQVSTFERLGSDDLETYEEKQKAKWEAEYKAKLAAQQPTFDEPDDDEDDPSPGQPQTPMPSSFAGKRSAPTGDRSSPVGVKPLGAILADKPTRQQKRQR